MDVTNEISHFVGPLRIKETFRHLAGNRVMWWHISIIQLVLNKLLWQQKPFFLLK
jgi:hypothetical protein